MVKVSGLGASRALVAVCSSSCFHEAQAVHFRRSDGLQRSSSLATAASIGIADHRLQLLHPPLSAHSRHLFRLLADGARLRAQSCTHQSEQHTLHLSELVYMSSEPIPRRSKMPPSLGHRIGPSSMRESLGSLLITWLKATHLCSLSFKRPHFSPISRLTENTFFPDSW